MTNSSVPWWSGKIRKDCERRLSRATRLERLGISEDEFRLYKDLFLKHRKRDTFAEHTEDGSWPQFKYRWNDSLILRHLCGDTCVAIPFGEKVNQVVLDIDNHGDRDWSEVEETVRLSASALPGEPLVYRSSESRGIRMIWFLNKAVSKPALHEWSKDKLSEAGVVVASGKCEVRLGTEPDRLPFGCESMLLDQVTLEPHFDLDLSTTLVIVREHREQYAVDPPTLLPTRNGQVSHEYSQIIRVCLDTGLPPDVTTNECLMKLNWHGRTALGLEKEELKVFLQDWITNCHNGNSDRVNKGKIHLIYDQIARLVDKLRVEPGYRRQPIMRVGLSREELLGLLDYPVNFKTAGGLFRLLCFSKAKLLHQLENKRLPSTNNRKKIGTNKWGRVFTGNQDIPNGAGNFHLYIDLSKRLLRLLKVPNAENTARFVADMERMGVIRHKRKAWPDGGKARQYWVNFPFDPSGKPVADDFDRALWEVIGFDGIWKRFSRHQAKRIAWKMRNLERKEACEESHLAMV